MGCCFKISLVLTILLPILLSFAFTNNLYPHGENETSETEIQYDSISFQYFKNNSYHSNPFFTVMLAATNSSFSFNHRIRDGSNLVYDFYRDSCPQAQDIVRSAIARIYFDHRDVSPALLRLFFHDCFIQGCDASILLDDSNSDKNRSAEKQAIPNQTLKGFDKIDMIKEELEQACPGVVSCADILALATRDAVLLAGGPFYPVLTGRKDSHRSFFEEATNQIPRPDDNVTRTLHLFGLKGFNERETVSLLGGHSIGKIGCDFIHPRLYNFMGTGQPDPSIPHDFLLQMWLNCPDNTTTTSDEFPDFVVSKQMSSHSDLGMSYMQALSASVSSGAAFDTHYYQSLLRGRGLLFADQQLMAAEKTARLVSAYASDDGSTFRMDFARVMLKMSNLDVLSGLQGQIRLNCSQPVSS
ncbi:PREDICTED: putative Peroxidase 48 [Lupinus angustifolius]|nr:PREDICTED: putative Peroxidase 48 [Lupinus angustifolius]